MLDSGDRAAPGEATGTCTEFGMVRDTSSPYTVIILSNSSQGTCHTVGRRIYNSLVPRSAGGGS